MMKRFLFLVLLAVALLPAAPRHAAASPFCVQVTGIPNDCSYVDPDLCRKRANDLKGLCVANPMEIKILPGNGRYCLVTADRASMCVYDDFQTCDNEAARHGQAVCFDTGPKTDQPDIYRTEPGRRY